MCRTVFLDRSIADSFCMRSGNLYLTSVVLSTHTAGFSGYTFRDLTEDMPAIKNHWAKENRGLLIVDPAMADNGKLYPGFDAAFVEAMKELCGRLHRRVY